MRRIIPILTACVAVTALALAGCSGNEKKSPSTPSGNAEREADAAALEAISLTGEPGKAPILEWTPPISVKEPVAREAQPGTG